MKQRAVQIITFADFQQLSFQKFNPKKTANRARKALRKLGSKSKKNFKGRKKAANKALRVLEKGLS